MIIILYLTRVTWFTGSPVVYNMTLEFLIELELRFYSSTATKYTYLCTASMCLTYSNLVINNDCYQMIMPYNVHACNDY